MSNINIVFVGLSKNCFQNVQKNIIFLESYKKSTKYNLQIIVIDSDSTDGTKEFCIKKNNEKIIDEFIQIDNLEKKYDSRIERIAVCRNKGIETFKDKIKEFSIYIPMDLDLNLFKFVDIETFESLIDSFIDNNNAQGYFPFSFPYYYDIFALRKKGWVDGNALLNSFKLKRKFIIGAFIFNYIYIFSKKIKKEKFIEDLIPVESAFGGIGLYKVNNSIKYYELDKNDKYFISEHISFNEQFNYLFIYRDWAIEAPLEHVRFKSYNSIEKIIYVCKTLKYDFISLKNKLLGIKK